VAMDGHPLGAPLPCFKFQALFLLRFSTEYRETKSGNPLFYISERLLKMVALQNTGTYLLPERTLNMLPASRCRL
jgi:hypothetical protein